jgi:ActR/RegA family two-component response regulator
LWNWTRHLGNRAASHTCDADEGSGVQSVLISCDEEYRLEWQRIFNSRGWDLECAATLNDALQMLCTRPVPLVVYDLQAADEDWRESLGALRDLPHHPCVLLTSSVIDEGFRDEVVRHHGYDVLSRHADEDEIGRTINSAWFWKHRHA